MQKGRKKTRKKDSKFGELIQWVETFILAILIALIIRGFIFEPVIVRGISMEDTLLDSQRLIIYKSGYFFQTPKQGDIIVLQYQKGSIKDIPFLNKFEFLSKLEFLDRVLPSPTEIDYIKRVIGVPGDKLDIKDGYIYVNGIKQNETYAKGETHKQTMEFPAVVPENTVFVLGDNRQNSRDSRVIGFVQVESVKGKAVLRIWPFKDWTIFNK